MTATLILLFLVFCGSGLGGGFRFFLAETVQKRFHGRLPIGTMVVNIAGSFLIGLLSGVSWDFLWPLADEYIRVFLMAGFLGGFTTVSTFSLETFTLFQNGRGAIAVTNILGTCSLCFLGVYLGQAIMRSLLLIFS